MAGKVGRWSPTYRAPIAPLNALSNDTMPDGPMLGVATGGFPPAFGRFVSVIVFVFVLTTVGALHCFQRNALTPFNARFTPLEYQS